MVRQVELLHYVYAVSLTFVSSDDIPEVGGVVSVSPGSFCGDDGGNRKGFDLLSVRDAYILPGDTCGGKWTLPEPRRLPVYAHFIAGAHY